MRAVSPTELASSPIVMVFLNFGNEKKTFKKYFIIYYDVTYDEITYFSNVKFRVFSSFSFLTFLKKNSGGMSHMKL